MLYEVGSEIKEISLKEMSGEKFTAGFLTIKEAEENNDVLNISEQALKDCQTSGRVGTLRSSIDTYEDYSFGIINVVNVKDVWGEKDRIGFLIKKNLFLLMDIVDKDKSTYELFDFAIHRLKPERITMEKIIYSFFESLLRDDNRELEETELEISDMEEAIAAGNTGRAFTSEMLAMKKKLLMLHSYYEQLIDIGEELQENRNDIFDDEHLHYFKLFTKRAERLSQNVQRLRENVVQIREANQANMDYNLNSVMKMFTVVTTIFLPLTLIVGWYGMNFEHMPEYRWRFGYAGVISLCVIVIVFCIWLFKKKKLL